MPSGETHALVLDGLAGGARRLLWLVTADLKDLQVNRGRRSVPFLQILAGKVAQGVQVRQLHAEEPG